MVGEITERMLHYRGVNVGTQPTGEYGRLNNGVFYDSPVVNGFQGHISGSFEKSPQVDGSGQGNNLGAAVTYNLGPVSMMLGSTENTSGDTRALLGGKYTIGTLEIMGGVDRSSFNGGSTITANTVGVSYGMGKYRFMANVGTRNPPAAATPEEETHDRFLGVGASYAIDKMTNVYVSVGNKSFKTASSQSAYGVGINYRF
jgi:predicted porin